MKGLLLKDWYLARTHCRAFLLILFVFAIVSAYSENNAFAVLYPIIFCLLYTSDAATILRV